MKAKQKSKTVIMILIAVAAAAALLALVFWGRRDTAQPEQPSGQIFLYGERHSDAEIKEKEFELWSDYYHNKGMRHLFVESPYYRAEYMNLWMQSDNDDILDELFQDARGTAGDSQASRDFYKRVKEECPETIFHGTDVGHQYYTTGRRYLQYLYTTGQETSEACQLTQENIQQGAHYYGNVMGSNTDEIYRENMMVENFIREFESLDGENIMGIYGAAHTDIGGMDYSTRTVPCMANQLHEKYGDALHTEDLRLIKEPLRTDTLTIDGKAYTASYFGKVDLSGNSSKFQYREFWRLEDAYDDFKDVPANGKVVPYDDFPMVIEEKQVFVVKYAGADGSAMTQYLRSDGTVWEGWPSTDEFRREIHMDPLRTDTLTVGGKEYTASYFGKVDLSADFPEFQYREFWRLENAYDDFKDCPTVNNALPYAQYPMGIEEKQVFVIQYTKPDGSIMTQYHRSDGAEIKGHLVTGEFSVE